MPGESEPRTYNSPPNANNLCVKFYAQSSNYTLMPFSAPPVTLAQLSVPIKKPDLTTCDAKGRCVMRGTGCSAGQPTHRGRGVTFKGRGFSLV